MNKKLQQEIQGIINNLNLNCSIDEFKDIVNWYNISEYQKLSEDFIREFKDKVNINIQEKCHKEKTREQKLEEIKEYAKKHNLEFDGEYLYAYRQHDFNGCGVFNKTIIYEKGQYYKDWHCDMNEENENSFGLGIWPNNKDVNIKVKVKVDDWGCAVNRRNDGKARVWGFEMV